MTDPIAEAAAQQAQTEPSLLERAEEKIHELEVKLDHLIHPVEDAAPSSTDAAQEVAASTAGESVTAASSAEKSATPAALQEPSTTPETAASSVASAPEASQAPAEQSTSIAQPVAQAEAPNAAPTPPAGDAGEAGNGANGATASVSEIATGGETPNVAVLPAVAASESATPDPSISVAIREHLQTIRSHLSLMGFEQSSVEVIHSAMAEIEKLL